MIAGLPVESWILLLASVAISLGIELTFYRAQRRRRARRERSTGGAGESPR